MYYIKYNWTQHGIDYNAKMNMICLHISEIWN